jgi:hypothetical protein
VLEDSPTDPLTVVLPDAPGALNPAQPRALGVGAPTSLGLVPPLVSPPQYSPANNTVAVAGSDSVAEDESNDADAGHAAPSAGTAPGAVFWYCMS